MKYVQYTDASLVLFYKLHLLLLIFITVYRFLPYYVTITVKDDISKTNNENPVLT